MEFLRTIPILRIFDVAKAKEFYVDYLGFTLEWEHHFEENTPAYMQVRRGNLTLHLSEHYGDGTPGTIVFVDMQGVEELHQELTAKNYKYLRPGIQDMEWGTRNVTVSDPFGNRISFNEYLNR
jgi:uncharacterized glyoxalase superfamily protein PhnB